MQRIEWRLEFETGDGAVDYEHRQLIDILNELLDTIGDGQPSDDALNLLGDLNARICGHFALEELEMQRDAYDDYTVHKEDHEHLLDQIRDLMDAYENGSYSQQSGEFTTRLQDWFINHFKTHDARLHRRDR